MSELVIGVTGSREVKPEDAWVIWRELGKIDARSSHPIRLLHGECPYGGADLIAASWATGAGWEVEPFPAEANAGWAYAKRNRAMVNRGPDLFLVFYKNGAGNRGTRMTRNMALDAGLRIEEFWI